MTKSANSTIQNASVQKSYKTWHLVF